MICCVRVTQALWLPHTTGALDELPRDVKGAALQTMLAQWWAAEDTQLLAVSWAFGGGQHGEPDGDVRGACTVQSSRACAAQDRSSSTAAHMQLCVAATSDLLLLPGTQTGRGGSQRARPGVGSVGWKQLGVLLAGRWRWAVAPRSGWQDLVDDSCSLVLCQD